MKCPKCGCETKVVDSREYMDSVRRRRECLACGVRYTTLEQRISLLSSKSYHKHEDTLEMLEMYRNGASYEAIASAYGISRQAVQQRFKRLSNVLFDF
jgi:transcriptional regulator NrdR family protein